MTSKQDLRLTYKAKRKSLSDPELEELSIDLANMTLPLDIWDYRYYHIFLPIERLREVNTQYLLTVLQGKDKSVVLSRSDFESGQMQHILLEEHTIIRTNIWGIPEPEEGIEIPPTKLDVIFVPLLAFDNSGNRIGYGKGFYDKFLSECRDDALFIGLSYFGPVDHINPDRGDIPLTMVITPDRVYRFR